METYTVKQLYELALQTAEQIVHDRTVSVAWLVAIATFIALTAVGRLIGFRRLAASCMTLVVVFFLAVGSFFMARGDINGKMDRVSHELANAAITQGVDQARKAQATELQYIHAAVNYYGIQTIPCSRTVDYHDECQAATGWYSHEEINVHYVPYESCTPPDSNGNKSCSTEYRREWDDEYTPYFAFVVKYWVAADTKAKYLHEGVYGQKCLGEGGGIEECNRDKEGKINDSRRPVVFVHTNPLAPDWRGPEDPAGNTYNNRGLSPFWQYNARVPEFWARVRSAARTGGGVVVANFVGPYFHWGLASESAQYVVYDGHYRSLKALVELPGPNGVQFSYTDAFGQPATMQTLLTSRDADLALDFQPVMAIGLNCTNQEALSQRAMEFQGHFGPNKEASARWFLVSDSIVNGLGGLRNTAAALKSFLKDEEVWGHFRLPKNQVGLVASVSDDCQQITGRDMETGMPFGNVLVAQKMRLSMDPGSSLPLTPDNLLGSFMGRYATNLDVGGLTYEYSDMGAAGAAIGLLYEQTPSWAPPDPNSDECSTAPPEHLGFVRYQMCTQQYLESTIQINTDGALLILDQVKAGATASTPVWHGWLLLGLALLLAGVTVYKELSEESDYGYRQSTWR